MIDSFELDQICFNALKNSGVRGSDKMGPRVSSLTRRKPAGLRVLQYIFLFSPFRLIAGNYIY